MKKDDVKEFWEEKEKEKNSKLIIATVADYISGYENIKTFTSGLLYFMENGLYFENFSNNNWFSALFAGANNKEFKKVEFSIPKTSIIGVTDSEGKKNKKELNLKDKILRFLNFIPRFLIINYVDNNQKILLKFKSVEEPLNICEKYYEAGNGPL